MTSDEAERAAISAADRAGRPVETITLDNGVVLRIKHVSPMTLRAASAHLKRPDVPKVTIPDTDRVEDNPNDPDYLAALTKWSADVSEAGLTVALILGTEVESTPAGMPLWDSDQWIEELTMASEFVEGAPVPTIRREGKGRYLDWLRLYAVSSNTDLYKLTQVLTSGVALTEQEVQDAAESFRSVFARAAAFRGAIAIPAAVGNLDPPVDPGAGE